MSNNVRVRFAPSPTGPLHIGGVRTALFNYLFAKKHNGTFILRIEDTDQTRYVPGAEEYISESLFWCGMPYDEGPGTEGEYGPYRQSERKHLYRAYADQLIESGWAYYAFDTAEELDAHRKEHEEKGKTFIYNWHNRLKLKNSLALSPEEVQARVENGEEYVIRFKSPQDEKLLLKDLIRGEIEIDTNILDDKVLFKSDGMPTYHLANIVDDHLMEISHVIRGEEWLPSMALHILLYRAFDWKAPEFAHLPLILKPTGKGKLSKRDGDKLGFPVFPLAWNPVNGDAASGYRESGYFSDAVVNFLALLGWNPGTEQEIFNMEELIESFDIHRVNKSGARFDPEKIKWFNHHYLQAHPNEELAVKFLPFLEAKGIMASPEFVTGVVALNKERADFIADFWDLASYMFIAPESFDEKAVKKQWKEDTDQYVNSVIDLLEEIDDFTSMAAETAVKDWIAAEGLGFGKIMPPLRLALVGEMKGPHVFDIMAFLGKKETTARLRNAVKILG
ncbi:glutamate--tRNA ligase [Robertkochia solimangrovi]|uniref:glutamate--tRNA ligase n=1 Tax=Robertkochia solimangrovi TaxID=2213046 RepID=UPI0011813CB4|nr:glutamate--tRNA ligase [Robertkochia solimangrovi]TRZ46057.1 glutamate--tRNA ligase [Robertkochia solimangrovi]